MTNWTFSLAELFVWTTTVWFSPNNKTFFCITQNFFLYYIYCIFENGYLRYFKLDRKMKLLCGDNFKQKYSTTFEIILLVLGFRLLFLFTWFMGLVLKVAVRKQNFICLFLRLVTTLKAYSPNLYTVHKGIKPCTQLSTALLQVDAAAVEMRSHWKMVGLCQRYARNGQVTNFFFILGPLWL